jgi:hypothetical protein
MRIATVPDAEWIERVGPVEGVEVRSWDMSTPLPDPEIGYAVHPYLTSPARVANVGSVPGHRVVQLMTAGYDAHLAHLHADVSLCNAAGVHDAATAEQAVTLMLAALRGIPEFVQAQARATWLPIRMWSGLADKRVLIVGYGRIGRAIAARLAPFEVSLTAVASRPRAGDDLVPVVHGMDEWPTLLPHADVKWTVFAPAPFPCACGLSGDLVVVCRVVHLAVVVAAQRDRLGRGRSIRLWTTGPRDAARTTRTVGRSLAAAQVS